MCKKKIIAIYSLAHFLVDMSCAMLLYHLLYAGAKNSDSVSLVFSASFIILIYDFFAFVIELPLGLILDRLKSLNPEARNINGLLAAVSCAVIAVFSIAGSFNLISSPLIIPVSVAAGLANAAFHLGAGVDVIHLSDRKASLSGIFISAGAPGLFFGTNALSKHYENLLFSGAALLFMAVLIIWLYSKESFTIPNTDNTVIRTKRAFLILALSLLFLVVLYRSFLGFASKYSWRSGFLTGLIAVVSVFLGKLLGGITADRFGWRKTLIISMLICAIAALFSDTSLFAGCIVLFLFNMTMPIAMIGLANLMPAWKGVAFGLNTTALFLGFISWHMINTSLSGPVFALLVLFSAFILLSALIAAPEMEQ